MVQIFQVFTVIVLILMGQIFLVLVFIPMEQIFLGLILQIFPHSAQNVLILFVGVLVVFMAVQ